jgi:hypothetical protein
MHATTPKAMHSGITWPAGRRPSIATVFRIDEARKAFAFRPMTGFNSPQSAGFDLVRTEHFIEAVRLMNEAPVR